VATSNSTNSNDSSTDGRLLGILSIAASPGALLISPALFSIAGFFLSLLGLTIAAPKQKMLSIIGLVLALGAGAVGFAFNTPII
jgi:hypothetical protein